MSSKIAKYYGVVRGCLVVFIVLNLGGCFDYQEVEDVTLVSGIGVIMEQEEMVVHLELIEKGRIPSEGEGIKTIITKGKNFADAMKNIVLQNGKQPYFGHAQILVIDEHAISQLSSVVDNLLSQKDLRYDMQIVVARDAVAALFESKETLRAFDLYELLKVNRHAATAVSMRVLEYLAMRKGAYALPVITMMEKQPTLQKGAMVYAREEHIGVEENEDFVASYLMLDQLFEHAWYIVPKNDIDMVMGELLGLSVSYQKNHKILIKGEFLITENDRNGMIKKGIEERIRKDIWSFIKENDQIPLIDLANKFAGNQLFVARVPDLGDILLDVRINVMNSSNVRSD